MAPASTVCTSFSGAHLCYWSARSFDIVWSSLARELGTRPVALCEIAASTTGADDFKDSIMQRVGEFGFLLLGSVPQGCWLPKFGLERRLHRFTLSNPLLAIDMLGHDLATGLFMPIDMLLLECADSRSCSLSYLQPSSLLLGEPHKGLLDAAQTLDRKMAALAYAMTF